MNFRYLINSNTKVYNMSFDIALRLKQVIDHIYIKF